MRSLKPRKPGCNKDNGYDYVRRRELLDAFRPENT